jgi:hypothetical protein
MREVCGEGVVEGCCGFGRCFWEPEYKQLDQQDVLVIEMRRSTYHTPPTLLLDSNTVGFHNPALQSGVSSTAFKAASPVGPAPMITIIFGDAFLSLEKPDWYSMRFSELGKRR